MNLGDTFRRARSIPGYDERRHLWIVISDPAVFPDEVVTVFIATQKRGLENTCEEEPGDHPFVEHRSTIAYNQIQIRTNNDLDEAIANGDLVPHEPASRVLVQDIRMKLPYSPRVLGMFLKIASRQGFDQPLP